MNGPFLRSQPDIHAAAVAQYASSELLTLYLKYVAYLKEEGEVQKALPYDPVRYIRTFEAFSEHEKIP